MGKACLSKVQIPGKMFIVLELCDAATPRSSFSHLSVATSFLF